MNQKGFTPIAVLLIIVALAVYVVYQKQYKSTFSIVQPATENSNTNSLLNPNGSINVNNQKENQSQPYLEENHIIRGDLTFEQKLPQDNGPIWPGGWVSRYWKIADPLVVLVIPGSQTVEGTFAALDFMAYKGLLLHLKGSKDYGDTKITVEIFQDPQFLDAQYYNKSLKSGEYCQKILGVYTVDPSRNYKNKSLGKWNCPK